jgi:hypothetical protein
MLNPQPSTDRFEIIRGVGELVVDAVEHLHVNGPWKYKLSDIYYEPAVTDTVAKMTMEPILATAS